MKKILLFIVLVAALAVALYLILNRSNKEQNVSLVCQAPFAMATRILATDTFWEKGLGIKQPITDSQFSYNNRTYTLRPYAPGNISIVIASKKDTLASNLIFSQFGMDSLLLAWNNDAAGAGKSISKDQAFLLDKVAGILTDEKAVYGLNITPGFMTDSIVLTSAFTSPSMPNTATVYTYINGLLSKARSQEADTTNSPMVNFSQLQNGDVLLKLAIPVNKRINVSGDLEIRRMVMGKNISSIVYGGTAQTEEAVRIMQLYMSDHSLTMPGIPFTFLETDRTKETDSLKWKNRVVVPVY